MEILLRGMEELIPLGVYRDMRIVVMVNYHAFVFMHLLRKIQAKAFTDIVREHVLDGHSMFITSNKPLSCLFHISDAYSFYQLLARYTSIRPYRYMYLMR